MGSSPSTKQDVGGRMKITERRNPVGKTLRGAGILLLLIGFVSLLSGVGLDFSRTGENKYKDEDPEGFYGLVRFHLIAGSTMIAFGYFKITPVENAAIILGRKVFGSKVMNASISWWGWVVIACVFTIAIFLGYEYLYKG